MQQQFFATTAKGMEGLLKDELLALGAPAVKETRAGVYFTGDMALAYRVCLWSRLANHILLPLFKFPARTQAELYDAIADQDWLEHIASTATFRIDVDGSHEEINNTQFIAQKAKDAIVDQIRAKLKVRPSVALNEPDVVLHIYVQGIEFSVSVSLSGESLHKRGYRLEGGRAPLKETLAATILLRAGWQELLKQNKACLIDPMCGSGTLLIEAAMMAYDIAPGLNRSYFGFLGWRGHRKTLWLDLIKEATLRKNAKLATPYTEIIGYDIDPVSLEQAHGNIRRAGLSDFISIHQQDARELTKPALQNQTGLLVFNPPYGERLMPEEGTLPELFKAVGERLKTEFLNWELAIFTAAPELIKSIGIRSYKIYKLYNGPLNAELLRFKITDEYFMRYETAEQKLARQATIVHEVSENALMFANRLSKNLKHLSKWAKRENIHCYRLYDADLPDYSIAVDLYEDKVHVQEYQADACIDPQKTQRRLVEAVSQIQSVLSIPSSHIFVKIRQRQKGENQYEKLAEKQEFHIVKEGQAKFYVNYTDYLDTGIFLDHRIMRQKVAEAAVGKSLLNLFAYTCTASVHAALLGAKSITSVDMSNTYLDWGKQNFVLNDLDPKLARFVQADCIQWLAYNQEKFDVIFLDPPTFSNSKRMDGTFEVQRDHVALLKLALAHLAPGGILFFSNNFRKFKLDTEALSDCVIEEISQACLPEDFKRRPNIHHCWKIHLA